MSTLVTTPARRVAPAAREVHGLSARGILASEWTKFRSLRSSWITLAVALVLTIGIGALVSAVQANHYASSTPADKATFDAVVTPLNGIILSQLAIGVLGVLVFSGEYSTGMIRATLTAVPRRLPVLWAKIAVFGAAVFVTSIVATFVSFFLGEYLLNRHGIGVGIGHADALRSVIGGALYLVVVGFIGVALGAALRNTAGGISAFVGLFFVLPPILFFLPASWSNHISPYLPAGAGQALWSNPDPPSLSPWAGFGVLCLWAAGAIVIAAVGLRRRDA
jgi:ABC-2 type transport system permease protein